MQTVGVYEAKTKLAAILDHVCEGDSFTITRHGVPIATISPAESPATNVHETIAAIRASRKKFAAAFKGTSVKKLIEEGRR
ncbi:MAG: type II toxin-antitoxin system prevent-host-death family antitoxin [Proteobacteria bacterium]|nr:type II toxin-antitoxin system prevent-host-death family antitoxin [Pseudomonadota bacterium]MCL2307897.1 type II toxin-antitoxin system prevent-host-death family antitoxin [Pseudomonadota bacterium]